MLQRLAILEQPVQLGMQLDVDLAEQTSPDDLPDQTKNQMLSNLDNVSSANVDNRAADALCRFNDNVVVLSKVEVVQRLDLLARFVEHTLVDGVRHAIVDEFGQDKAVFAGIEHLKGIGGEGQSVANVGVASKDCIDVARELGPLVLVDRMCRMA